MPRAILAIRQYPTALLLAAMLFALTLLLAAGSLGYIGGDDGGSGLGGTGRIGDFEGSGLGGTGAPSPFFGASDDTMERDDSAPAVNDPEALDRAMRRSDRTDGPAALEIREPLQTADLLDDSEWREQLRRTRQALRDNALRHFDPPGEDRVIELRITLDNPVGDNGPDFGIEPYSLPESAADADAPVEIAGERESREAAGDDDGTDQRVSPERIQRPELPPLQRVRPVERASIPVPGPRPMRL
ncbi:MAG: hypothetical protein ACQETO_09630 [Pseudomonadota bacterium]